MTAPPQVGYSTYGSPTSPKQFAPPGYHFERVACETTSQSQQVTNYAGQKQVRSIDINRCRWHLVNDGKEPSDPHADVVHDVEPPAAVSRDWQFVEQVCWTNHALTDWSGKRFPQFAQCSYQQVPVDSPAQSLVRAEVRYGAKRASLGGSTPSVASGWRMRGGLSSAASEAHLRLGIGAMDLQLDFGATDSLRPRPFGDTSESAFATDSLAALLGFEGGWPYLHFTRRQWFGDAEVRRAGIFTGTPNERQPLAVGRPIRFELSADTYQLLWDLSVFDHGSFFERDWLAAIVGFGLSRGRAVGLQRDTAGSLYVDAEREGWGGAVTAELIVFSYDFLEVFRFDWQDGLRATFNGGFHEIRAGHEFGLALYLGNAMYLRASLGAFGWTVGGGDEDFQHPESDFGWNAGLTFQARAGFGGR